MNSNITIKGVLLAFGFGLFLFCSDGGYAVTNEHKTPENHEIKITNLELATPDLSKRAHADVQLRRLFNLFAERKLNSDELIEKVKAVRGGR